MTTPIPFLVMTFPDKDGAHGAITEALETLGLRHTKYRLKEAPDDLGFFAEFPAGRVLASSVDERGNVLQYRLLEIPTFPAAAPVVDAGLTHEEKLERERERAEDRRACVSALLLDRFPAYLAALVLVRLESRELIRALSGISGEQPWGGQFGRLSAALVDCANLEEAIAPNGDPRPRELDDLVDPRLVTEDFYRSIQEDVVETTRAAQRAAERHGAEMCISLEDAERLLDAIASLDDEGRPMLTARETLDMTSANADETNDRARPKHDDLRDRLRDYARSQTEGAGS